MTLAEAWRARLLLAACATALAATLLAALLGQVAITETREIQATLSAALLRLAAVALVTLFVAASQVREADSHVLEWLLALPYPRWVYYAGRLAGFVSIGWAVAALCVLPLLPFAPLAASLAWGVSLGCELTLVAAAALFFVSALGKVPAAGLAVAGLYLLARGMASLQLMATSPLLEESAVNRLLRHGLDAVAWLLPRLDTFTQSAWLAGYPGGWSALPGIALQTGVYAALLVIAGLIDLQRRSFSA